MSCPFCNINNEQTRIIEEGNYCIVVLSNPRLMTGHILIIPKRHSQKLSDLDTDEKQELFALIEKYQDKILKNISSGCDVRHHFRPFIKQSNVKIDHLHFHLQPRELFDDLYERCQKHETNIFQSLPNKEIDLIIDKLK